MVVITEMIALFGTHSAIALAHEIAMPWHNFRSHQCFQEVVALHERRAWRPTLLPMIEIVGTGRIAARRALAPGFTTRNQGRVSI